MKKLSIIIPAFNSASYLSTAISSIYSQEQDESLFSVIVVNDGSSDNTCSLVNDYLDNHSNLYLVNQDNKGVSAARNNGIRHSEADFITFLDADDSFALNSLSSIFKILDNNKDSDLIILRSFNDTDSIERYAWTSLFETDRSYSFFDLYNCHYNRGSACGCLYRSSFLSSNHIEFPVGVSYGEDSIFFSLCLIQAPRIKFYDVDFYHITTRDNSALTTYNRAKVARFQRSIDYLETFITEHSMLNDELSVLYYLQYRLISRCIHDACYAEDMSLNDILHLDWLKSYLPIEMKGIKQQRYEILLLNKCYPLFCLLSYLKNNLRKWGLVR